MRRIKSRSGVSAVEFALVLPLLAVILFGVIEFGLLLFNKQVITNASREGARRGIVQDDPRITIGEIESVVETYCKDHLIGFSSGEQKPVTTVSAPCTAFADPLTVTVNYNYQFLVFPNLLDLLGGALSSSINLSSATMMRCE